MQKVDPTDPEARLPPTAPPAPPSPRKPTRRRRPCLVASLCCLSTVVILAIIILILALTVFKRKDPTTSLVSFRVDGIAPSITFPAMKVQLNLTIDVDILVYNPNRVSFTHAPSTVVIYYRGTEVGNADVPSGTIPSRGSEHLLCNVTLTMESFLGSLGSLVGDVLKGELGLDTAARIPGKVKLLGFINKHVVAYSNCHIVVGVLPSLAVKQQTCSQKTKL